MRHARRMRAAGAAVACGHVALGLLAGFGLGVPGAPLFFGLCAAVSLGLAVVVAPLLRPAPPPPDGGGRGGTGGGKGGGGPGGEPPWWPDFERDLRAWAERERSPA